MVSAQANSDTPLPARPNSNCSDLSQPNINVTCCPYLDDGCTQPSEQNIKYTCNTSTSSKIPDSHLKPTGLPVPGFQGKLLNRSTILAELAALQSRCTALQNALVGTTSTTPSCPHGYGQTCSHSHSHSTIYNTGTWYPGVIVSNTRTCAPTSSHFDVDQVAATANWKFPNPTGQRSSSFRMDHSGSYQLNQNLSREDCAVPNDAACNIFDFEFQEYFDLTEASLPPAINVEEQETVLYSTSSPALEINGDTPCKPSDASRVQDAAFTIVPPANIIQRRFHCQHCMMTFRRPSDRDRHALAHNPNAPRFSCTYPGCTRVGRRGFLRKDKLTQHQVHMNH
ncbi:hypothetical protein BDZ45DRAFT_675234 [Acephala macrosclerotiorum]|nr:hypothetical protein BDZ45DRAFT_675234 [Acephala macrosclerotiorum]